jgi:hypothetical protein
MAQAKNISKSIWQLSRLSKVEEKRKRTIYKVADVAYMWKLSGAVPAICRSCPTNCEAFADLSEQSVKTYEWLCFRLHAVTFGLEKLDKMVLQGCMNSIHLI